MVFENVRDLRITKDWIGVCDGASTLRTAPRRGCLSYLTHVDGVRGTASDPRVAQYQRQIGATDVAFSAGGGGPGTLDVGVAMGTNRVPLAQIAGTNCGAVRWCSSGRSDRHHHHVLSQHHL